MTGLNFESAFYEVAALLAIATAIGLVALKLRQPLVMAFIAVGILAGPAGLGWLAASEEVELFAELGIALLLFVVGLKLDPYEIRAFGPVAGIVGLGQVGLTGILGYLLAIALGFDAGAAFYIAAALTFSSTVIIVKLLSDRKEIDALHGRLAIGILIVQDLVVVLLAIALTAFSNVDASANLGLELTLVLAKGLAFLVAVGLFTRLLLGRSLNVVARSPELLVLAAIAWAISLAAIGDGLGFSKEVGAFLAGVAIATTPYRTVLAARLVSLRDFLLLFFFVNLGAHIDISHFGSQIGVAFGLSLFVLVGKPLMVMVLMGLAGYRKYTSAMTSLTLGQISEFSLILATLGESLGHISSEVVGLITLVGLITMSLSSHAILQAHHIYGWLSPGLKIFERQRTHPEEILGTKGAADPAHIDAIVFGLGRYGGKMVKELEHQGLAVLGVDFDPEIVQTRRLEGLSTRYGDAEDPEFAATLPLKQAQWVVSTVPNRELGLLLLQVLRQHNYGGNVAVTSHFSRDRDLLLEAGADLVLCPYDDAAKEAATALATGDRSSSKSRTEAEAVIEA